MTKQYMSNKAKINKSCYGLIVDLLQIKHIREIPNLVKTVYSIVTSCFNYYEDVQLVSFVKILGEGSYNIIIELAIETIDDMLFKALRLNKKNRELKGFDISRDLTPDPKTGAVSEVNRYGVMHMPKVETRDFGWKLTPKYYSFKRIWDKLINLKVAHEGDASKIDKLNYIKEALNWLVCKYAVESLDIIKYVHSKDMGVFDWK